MRTKFFFLFFLLTLRYFASYGCSCQPVYGFCYTQSTHQFVASFEIVDSFPNGISLRVLQKLRGTEARDTITLWDIPFSACNPGPNRSVGDTVIMAISRIDTLEAPWDVMGDYRRSYDRCGILELDVIYSTVIGFYNGINYGGSFCFNCADNIPYQEFLAEFPVYMQSCQTWVFNQEIMHNQEFNLSPNPANESVRIETNQFGTLSIFNSFGQLIKKIEFGDSGFVLPVSDYLRGLYFFRLNQGRATMTKKLLLVE